MSKKPKKPRQMGLFSLPPIHEYRGETPNSQRFYYLSDAKQEKMLAIDDKGRQVIVRHDLQHAMPYLISSQSTARRLAAAWCLGVKVYPYDPRWQQMSARTGSIIPGK